MSEWAWVLPQTSFGLKVAILMMTTLILERVSKIQRKFPGLEFNSPFFFFFFKSRVLKWYLCTLFSNYLTHGQE